MLDLEKCMLAHLYAVVTVLNSTALVRHHDSC